MAVFGAGERGSGSWQGKERGRGRKGDVELWSSGVDSRRPSIVSLLASAALHVVGQGERGLQRTPARKALASKVGCLARLSLHSILDCDERHTRRGTGTQRMGQAHVEQDVHTAHGTGTPGVRRLAHGAWAYAALSRPCSGLCRLWLEGKGNDHGKGEAKV
eukprot:364735-Chlamydomonas_euryale.AAC.4